MTGWDVFWPAFLIVVGGSLAAIDIYAAHTPGATLSEHVRVWAHTRDKPAGWRAAILVVMIGGGAAVLLYHFFV